MKKHAVMVVLDLDISTNIQSRDLIEKVVSRKMQEIISPIEGLEIKMLRTKFLGKIEEGQ